MALINTGGGSLGLPLDLGPGLFQIDANGNVTISPNALSGAALSVQGADALHTVVSVTDNLGNAFASLGPNNDLVTGAGNYECSLFASDGNAGVEVDNLTGAVTIYATHAGFFGGTPATKQTLASATATPEQIALALEASTLMGGT